jgi:hypothetical protein
VVPTSAETEVEGIRLKIRHLLTIHQQNAVLSFPPLDQKVPRRVVAPTLWRVRQRRLPIYLGLMGPVVVYVFTDVAIIERYRAAWLVWSRIQ